MGPKKVKTPIKPPEVSSITQEENEDIHNRLSKLEDQIKNVSENSNNWVFLRLQPYKQISLKQQKKDNKLAPKYYGPCKLLERIGNMAYKLELPPSSRVHLVFHVSCLKKVIDNKIRGQTILPKINEEGKIILEPETIHETRIKRL